MLNAYPVVVYEKEKYSKAYNVYHFVMTYP